MKSELLTTILTIAIGVVIIGGGAFVIYKAMMVDEKHEAWKK